jgi:mono/diheme cytochrome c family protein
MRSHRLRSGISVCLVLALGVALAAGADNAPDVKRLPPASAEQFDFLRDVRPLLVARCYRCHGPNKQTSGLALHRRNRMLAGGDSGPAIVPGKSEKSRLIHYVAGLDGDHVMPPPGKGERLTSKEIGLLRAWIDQGARWPESDRDAADHWAYRKPVRPKLPAVKDAGWVRNGIDVFVLARLEKEGLKPSPEADRATLIRRVSLDLTGLPPTVAEVDAFLADARPDAYERLVERLLSSPRYGERWARPWLDLARYADTNGYEKDRPRIMWLWRDWVIQALNADMPFDQFTIEQLAGDLLPVPASSSGSGGDKEGEWQKVATGFHRNSMLNDEGGINPEEFRVVAVKDRVDTTATVWLGATLECAQCHSHKYDPFTQEEYYRFLAFFNHTADTGVGNGPEISVSTRADQLHLDRITSELAALDTKLNEYKDRPGDPRAKKLRDEISGKMAEMLNVRSPTTMVMQELAKPRPNFIMLRGDFRQKGKAVEPGTPAALHPFPKDAPHNRLGLARWLVSPDNPLVGRVTVNRHWHAFFGRGLVQTPEDFGTQGDRPTHPELLDWLAVEFTDRNWSMKRLHRLIVTSATYRQSSRVSPELLKRDPYDALYARGPRLRVEYETLRDLSLSAGDLLSQKIGGPSVMPPQPSGIWENSFGFYDLPNFRWKEDTGEDRYRRGIYIFLRRSALYPTFKMFDAPSRDVCSVRRPRTNTPLQALATLNDPVFVEAAGGLAQRVLTQIKGDTKARATFVFRICVARPPRPGEVEKLVSLYEKALAKYRADPKAAEKLVKHCRVRADRLKVEELAAWTVVANVLLSLDETLTKG